MVRPLLRQLGFSLQANAKVSEGSSQHPDPDAEFAYLNDQAAAHLAAGDPVISVDAKKKKYIGEFRNGGREWQPEVPGAGERARLHRQGAGQGHPVRDLRRCSQCRGGLGGHRPRHRRVRRDDIARWWQAVGQPAYPAAAGLLICADGGGSNGYRTRLWKTELAALAASTGLAITVCHLPPGTSKWNKIEHRLFSHISMNWRGLPLTSHEVVVQTIAATTTRTGLTVQAELDTSAYPKGIKNPDGEIRDLEKQQLLQRHQFHGEWNYTLTPPHDTPEPG